VAVVGYVFQALALAHGSLLIVQPLLVSSLLFALPVSAHLAQRRVSSAEWAWAVLLTVALAVFVVLAHPRKGVDYREAALTWTLVAAVVIPIVVACVAIGVRSRGRVRAVLLAAAVGVLFGVVAVLTKITVQRLAEHGPLSLLAVPTPYLLVIIAVGATLLQQSALHAGALPVSVPTMLVLEPVVAVILGVVVLGEQLALGGVATAALPVAVAAMAAATVALGRDEGALEEQLQTAVGTRQQSNA
jgi:drug/metabolite transporter (DMT)-like permease